MNKSAPLTENLKGTDLPSSAHLAQLMQGGVDLNVLKTEKDKLLYEAMKRQDLKLLYLLWQQGVKSEHPYIGHLFQDFDQGYIPA